MGCAAELSGRLGMCRTAEKSDFCDQLSAQAALILFPYGGLIPAAMPSDKARGSDLLPCLWFVSQGEILQQLYYVSLSVTLIVDVAASPLTLVCGQSFSHVRQHRELKEIYHLQMHECKMQSWQLALGATLVSGCTHLC